MARLKSGFIDPQTRGVFLRTLNFAAESNEVWIELRKTSLDDVLLFPVDPQIDQLLRFPDHVTAKRPQHTTPSFPSRLYPDGPPVWREPARRSGPRQIPRYHFRVKFVSFMRERGWTRSIMAFL